MPGLADLDASVSDLNAVRPNIAAANAFLGIGNADGADPDEVTPQLYSALGITPRKM